MTDPLQEAARALAAAEALIITAGAGMGVDSGLPDFRGPEGFWRAYPPYRELGLSFEELANPSWFIEDPELAWGFYGHRLNLYRETKPHEGYVILRRWADRMTKGAFVFTSNVDGAFQRAGFAEERIEEVHGAIDWLQCMRNRGCTQGLMRADGITVSVDTATFRARPPLPRCPECGTLLRPNVLMFGDWGWNPERSEQQRARMQSFVDGLRRGRGRVVVVECGAGLAIPTVRVFSENTARDLSGTLIRINLRDPDVPTGQLSLQLGARDALTRLDALITP